MTNRQIDQDTEALDEVREAYRAAGFRDEPSAAVDAAILAAARRPPARRQFVRFLPPLALAATVVMAIGLFVRMSGPDIVSPETDIEALSADGIDTRAADGSATPAAPAVPSSSESAAPAAEGFQRTLPSTAVDSALDGGPGAATDRMAPAGADASPAGCDAYAGTADSWLACISALLAADDVARARSELAAFRAEFPDRPVPAALAAALAP